jgi:GR25 family glycosyltransferase involved in LPS biosynthesis
MYSNYQSNNLLIYCINLQHRKDRKIHTQKEFKKIGIDVNQVIYPPLVKDPRGGAYGCYDSHMKIWYNFFTKHPDKSYCLVFEDDFVAEPQARELLKKAEQFVNQNVSQIDLLLLHHLCIPQQHPLNNANFTHGYGLLTQAYFVTRPYIQSIYNKNSNKLPLPNGKHFDMSLNIDSNSLLYSEKIFYTKQPCFTQLLDKSDNYLNKLDELFRQDINKRIENMFKVAVFFKKMGLLTDNSIKKISVTVNKMFFIK